MSAQPGEPMSGFGSRVHAALLLGGAIGASLALPRVFESGQKPVVRALPPHDANTLPGSYKAPSSAFPTAPEAGATSSRLTIPGLGTVVLPATSGFVVVPGLPGVQLPVPGASGTDRPLPTRQAEPAPGP